MNIKCTCARCSDFQYMNYKGEIRGSGPRRCIKAAGTTIGLICMFWVLTTVGQAVFFLSLLLKADPLPRTRRVSKIAIKGLGVSQGNRCLIIRVSIRLSQLRMRTGHTMLLAPQLIGKTSSTSLPTINVCNQHHCCCCMEGNTDVLSNSNRADFGTTRGPRQMTCRIVIPCSK